MTPKKIYLSKEELQDITTCERMVSINEPFDVMTEEYVNLKHVWHDVHEEPERPFAILCAGINDDYWIAESDVVEEHFVDWGSFADFMGLLMWANISDLLPKVKSIIYREDWRE